MARIIRGNRDGPNNRNESFSIPVRGTISRSTAVKEVKAGKHTGKHVVTVNGREYVRDNPDRSTADNVNQE
jgi:hypothetical protein